MIWVVGGRGMLGLEVTGLLDASGVEYVATDVELDIVDSEAVQDYVRGLQPSCIVNCAAYTAVDRAEAEEDQATAVNVCGARNLAAGAALVAGRLLHVSTDYVFDGHQQEPYVESASQRPLSAYGRTKAAGEASVRASGAEYIIVRTSWLHGPHGSSFVSTVLRLMDERDELGVVADQWGRPTYATDLAMFLIDLACRPTVPHDTYHYANHGTCSWHGFATYIRDAALGRGLLRRSLPIHPISTSAYPRPATRPLRAVLDTARAEALLGGTVPAWQDGVDRHLDRIRRASA